MNLTIHEPSLIESEALTKDDLSRVYRVRFYSKARSATAHVLITEDRAGKVLDRAVVKVSPAGRITLEHLSDEVTPDGDAPASN